MAKSRYNVPALEKGIAIIEMLANSEKPLGITDIYTLSGVPKSSIFMILTTLESLQYVEKIDGDKYRPTMRIYNLGMIILSKLGIREAAHPIMEEIAKELRFTVHLAMLEQGKAVYIEKVKSPGFVQFSTEVGQSWLLYNSAVGKVLAAYMPEDQLDKVLMSTEFTSFTPNTMTSKEQLKQFLQSVREQGYAVEDEEGELGIRCIGVPIYNHTGNVVAALSITALRNDLPVHKFGEIGMLIRDKANRISERLGYRRAAE